jgi:hypothetical protein
VRIFRNLPGVQRGGTLDPFTLDGAVAGGIANDECARLRLCFRLPRFYAFGKSVDRCFAYPLASSSIRSPFTYVPSLPSSLS